MATPGPLRILIVEDDRTSRFVLSRMLKATGDHDIYEAEDGQEAWDMLNAGLCPNLCFLDLMMPRVNGIEFLRMLRADPRFSSLRVAFCSAIRDPNLIIQAASLKPDDYILKPYSREAIQTQVSRALGLPVAVDSLEPVDTVCARLGIDPAAYEARLRALVEHIRTVTVRLPTLVMQFDFNGVFAAIERTRNLAVQVGARRIRKLAEVLRRTLELNGGLLDTRNGSKDQSAMQFQQWLGRSADQLMATIQEFCNEANNIERFISKGRDGESGGPRNALVGGHGEADLTLLFSTLAETLPRGRVVSAGRRGRARSLAVPVKPALLGVNSARNLGGFTRRTSFTFSIFDSKTANAVDDLRKTTDLVKNLSLPLSGNDRWIPEAAIRLLEAEVASRDARSAAILQEAVGDNFDAFLERQEGRIREALSDAAWKAEAGREATEKEVEAVLKEVRERVQTALEGTVTMPSLEPSCELPNLTEHGDDSAWAIPFELLYHSALLQRSAFSDPTFNEEHTFATFDRVAYLRAMDIFDDVFARHLDPRVAAEEIRNLESIRDSPVDRREKCRLLWSMIRPKSDSPAAPAPVVPSDTARLGASLRPSLAAS